MPALATGFAGSLLMFAAALQTAPADQQAQPAAAAQQHSHANRVYIGQDIFVAPGQQIAKATCLFCSVQVEGEVSGNVVVLFGNLTVTGRVSGNTTVIGGNTVVDSQARIAGNTAVLGGNAVYETDDSLSGNVYILGGHISSFAGHTSVRRRVALSPRLFTAALVVLILLLAGLLFPRSRQRVVTR